MRISILAISALALAGLLSGCNFFQDEEEESFGISKQQRADVLKNAGLDSLAPGQWDSKLTVSDIELPGLAKSKKASIISKVEKQGSRSRCMSKDNAQDVSVDFFAKDAEDCRYDAFEIEDGKANIKLSCGLDSATTFEMEMNGPISRDQYSLDAKISLRFPMVGNVKAAGLLESKRVGDCTAQ